jgi:hypothetical protein
MAGTSAAMNRNKKRNADMFLMEFVMNEDRGELNAPLDANQEKKVSKKPF